MNSNNNLTNNNKLINTFNPSFSRRRSYKKNTETPSKLKKIIPLFSQNRKNSLSLKAHNINYNLNNIINNKNLENEDFSNDIKIKRFTNLYKTSLSCTNAKYNYYTKRRGELYKNIKTAESEITRSRNINNMNNNNNDNKKENHNTFTRTTWNSFSFKEGPQKIDPLKTDIEYKLGEYHLNMNLKNRVENFKNDYNSESFEILKFNRYDINKLEENGIKFCIDEDGNPMSIYDINTKSKKPIAFIIPKQNKNILIDLDNKIINQNFNGDYNLPQKPYFTIRKYDVQYPELRVNNLGENNKTKYNKLYNNNDLNKNIESKNNNYISIDVNDANENLCNNVEDIINREKIRRKNNKGCNLYNFTNLGINSKKNHFGTKNKDFDSSKNLFSPSFHGKISSYKQFKNSLRDKKRKYIFINKIPESNKSMKLQIKNNDDFSNAINNQHNKSINNIIQINNKFKNKENDSEYSYIVNIENKKDNSQIENKYSKKDYKLIIKNLNKLKNKTNKLKDIKCFTKKEIKNLEFKFERKYKTNNSNNSKPILSSIINSFKFLKNTKKNGNTKLNDETNFLKTEDNNLNDNKENETNNKIRYFTEKADNCNLKRCKKQRSSYSLNEFMYNNIEGIRGNIKGSNIKGSHNMLNTLSTFNHNSFASPLTETTSYTTIQNPQNELNKNKKSIILGAFNNTINVKKFNNFKYYLKPKENLKKISYKRISTEDINNGEKKHRFFKSITENAKNKTNDSGFRHLYNTGIQFCQHNSCNNIENIININNTDASNSVCKCPYCHHFFYG